jgi:hypothetical protein
VSLILFVITFLHLVEVKLSEWAAFINNFLLLLPLIPGRRVLILSFGGTSVCTGYDVRPHFVHINRIVYVSSCSKTHGWVEAENPTTSGVERWCVINLSHGRELMDRNKGS